jgi:hypothetical protein
VTGGSVGEDARLHSTVDVIGLSIANASLTDTQSCDPRAVSIKYFIRLPSAHRVATLDVSSAGSITDGGQQFRQDGTTAGSVSTVWMPRASNSRCNNPACPEDASNRREHLREGWSARRRKPNVRQFLWVDDVEVDVEVERAVWKVSIRGVRQLIDGALVDVRGFEHLAFAVIEVTGPDERDALLGNRRHSNCVEDGEVTVARDFGQGQSAEIAGYSGCFSVEVAMGIEPHHARRHTATLQTGDGSDRCRAVAGDDYNGSLAADYPIDNTTVQPCHAQPRVLQLRQLSRYAHGGLGRNGTRVEAIGQTFVDVVGNDYCAHVWKREARRGPCITMLTAAWLMSVRGVVNPTPNFYLGRRLASPIRGRLWHE